MALPLVTTAARQARVLRDTAHRPWPMPPSPWSAAESVVESVACHWPVELAALEPLLPAGVEPDAHRGQHWVSVSAVRAVGLRARGLLPVPRLSDGAHIALRTPVLVGGRPAALVLDSAFSNRFAAEAARHLYGLPAAHARVALRRDGASGAVRVEASRTRAGGAPAVFHARFEPIGPERPAEPDSLEAFLHERFLLVAARRGGLVLAEQHRRPWQLAPARVEIELDTLARPGLALGEPALACVAGPLDLLVWPPERVDV